MIHAIIIRIAQIFSSKKNMMIMPIAIQKIIKPSIRFIGMLLSLHGDCKARVVMIYYIFVKDYFGLKKEKQCFVGIPFCNI